MKQIVPLLVVLLISCAPTHFLSNAEIPTAKKLKDIMWAQAELADPAFKKINTTTYTDADWEVFTTTGKRLQLTSAKIKHDFSKGADWDAMASHLANGATDLIAAAEAKDGKATTAALEATRNSCRICHKRFR